MIPVGETRDDVLVEVGQHASERLRFARRPFAEGLPHAAGFDVGEDGELPHAASVVHRPLDGFVEGVAQRFRAPVHGRGVRLDGRAGGVAALCMVRHGIS